MGVAKKQNNNNYKDNNKLIKYKIIVHFGKATFLMTKGNWNLLPN